MISARDMKEKIKRLRKRPYWWDMPDEAYKELETVVGPNKISREKVVRQAYVGRGYARELFWFSGQAYPPCCVLQPETTEEVAAIVKICNKYHLPFNPCSSQWSYNANPRFRPDQVQIDLQRMQKIMMDKKNLYAQIQAGVRYGHFCQACFNNDCIFINTGGGSGTSVIANHTISGCSPLNYRMGNAQRRILSCIWVTPEGDIVTTGSWTGRQITLENGFWGDGLGPNLNGVWRGHIGWFGAMGIITEMTIKIFPFIENANKAMIPKGISPNSHIFFNTNRVQWQNIKLSSRKALEDYIYELSHAQIGAVITKVPVFWRIIARSKDKEDFWERWSGVTEEDIENFHMVRVLLVGFTNEKQMEYEREVLKEVTYQFKGEFKRTKPSDESWFKNADTSGMWMMTNGYSSCEGGQESLRCAYETGKVLGKILWKNYTPPFMPEYGDPGWFQSNDFGHSSYLEVLIHMNVSKCDPLSLLYSSEYIKDIIEWHFEKTPFIDERIGFFNFFPASGYPILVQGPFFNNYQIWIDRFKKEFDPKCVSNPPAPYDPETLIKELPEFIANKARRIIKTAKRG